MPTYTMRNAQTGETKEMILSLGEREALLAEGEWTQELSKPRIVSGLGASVVGKTDSGWKDVLSKIKSGSARSNTIRN